MERLETFYYSGSKQRTQYTGEQYTGSSNEPAILPLGKQSQSWKLWLKQMLVQSTIVHSRRDRQKQLHQQTEGQKTVNNTHYLYRVGWPSVFKIRENSDRCYSTDEAYGQFAKWLSQSQNQQVLRALGKWTGSSWCVTGSLGQTSPTDAQTRKFAWMSENG